MLFWFSIACQSDLQPPTCTNDSDYACFRGVFRTLLGAPVEDVEICAPDLESIDCVLTDEEGSWKLPGLPRDSNIFLTATHPDYVSSLFPQHSSMDWYDWYKVVIPTAIMSSNANRLDIELDPSKGQLLFLTWEGLNIDGIDTENVDGVTASPSPSAEHLFYGDALGLASSSQDATTSSGSGGILNLDEGEISLQLQAPLGECTQEHMFHYQRLSNGDIPIPIRAGFTTAIDVICPAE